MRSNRNTVMYIHFNEHNVTLIRISLCKCVYWIDIARAYSNCGRLCKFVTAMEWWREREKKMSARRFEACSFFILRHKRHAMCTSLPSDPINKNSFSSVSFSYIAYTCIPEKNMEFSSFLPIAKNLMLKKNLFKKTLSIASDSRLLYLFIFIRLLSVFFFQFVQFKKAVYISPSVEFPLAVLQIY